MNALYPKKMQEIIDFFKLFPGVGEKTAERYAFTALNFDDRQLSIISESLKNLKQNVKSCPNCGCLCDEGHCFFCEDESRKTDVICVVENQKNVFLFEKLGTFRTKYHVLGGLISPIDGIMPEKLSIDKLIKRIDDEKINEVILALKPGIEGSTTSLYIKKMLEAKNIKITQIAQGVPIGADMEYLDNLTLEMAIENRSTVS